ncbi:MAG: hypothetical protein DWQ04_09515 [Chloroflexi bacterium]|nr:MAG: hypothetical protein DWQ04_09515 [Chloroflexota bacterium]
MAQDRKRYTKAIRAGNIYLERESWQKALSAFRVAIDEFPKEAEPYAGLGQACMGMKQLNRALECYKLAARYSRGDVANLEKVADIQERMGLLGEAARTYMAAGEVLLKSRQLDTAVGLWQRAIRLDSNLLGAHKRLAMVFQRQNKAKDAVRSYLAIARILQMRGDNNKALRMCQAALRMDPENEDVLMAVDLIQKGEAGYQEEEEAAEVEIESEAEGLSAEELAEADKLTDTIRQLAAAFESDRQLEPAQPQKLDGDDPVAAANRFAQEELAAELFRDEDDDEDARGSLSKLERDALIGQGMDYEGRGQPQEALQCYEKAVNGGLRLPAIRFVMGMLYLEVGQKDKAEENLMLIATEPPYNEAVRDALQN